MFSFFQKSNGIWLSLLNFILEVINSMRFEKVLINVAFMASLLYFLRSAVCITDLHGNVRKVFSCAVIVNFMEYV